MTTRNFTPMLVATVLLLLPPALYVGSYCLLAESVYTKFGRGASYRYGGNVAEAFYKPLELADRRFRPREWEPLFVQPAAGEGP
jgi:hypothetical protein